MKTKRIISAIAFITSTLLFGCSDSSNKTIDLSIFAAAVPENSPTGDAVREMVNYINTKSQGTLKATGYFDSALGDGNSMVQGLTQGTIDIGVTGTSYFSGLVPQIEVFQLPFLFDNIVQARTAVDGIAGNKIIKMFEPKGIIGLCFWENGFRELTNNLRPIHNPEDLKGIKIRSLSSSVQLQTWKDLGALPTAIDASELYTSLQQGAVNAQENPLHEIVARKIYEVQKYISLTDHVYTPYFMGISEKTWNKLNEEQKNIIKEAALLGQKVQREKNDIAQTEALKTIEDFGCVVDKSPNKQGFKDATKDVWTVFTNEYGNELLNDIKQM